MGGGGKAGPGEAKEDFGEIEERRGRGEREDDAGVKVRGVKKKIIWDRLVPR